MFEWLGKSGGRLFFMLLFLGGVVFAIVYVNSRSKCTIPDNIDPLTTPVGSDGYPQVPVCPDELGAYIFEDATTRCGNPTVGMPPGKSPYYCDYSNNYSWVYQTSGKPQPSENTCDLTEGGLLPFPITYDKQTRTNIYTPVSNSLSYSYVSLGGGACFLSQCDSSTVVWPDKVSNAEFCAPNNAGTQGCPSNTYPEFKTSGASAHNTYPDSNAIYNYTYMSTNPTSPMCEFVSCSKEGGGFQGDPCMPPKPSDPCPLSKFPHAAKVDFESGECMVKECKKSGDPTWRYDIVKNVCTKICNSDGCKNYILDENSNCVADCTDPATYYYDVFKQSNCAAPPDVFSGFKAIRDPDDPSGRTCIPSDTGGIWGNCGNIENPYWALSDDGKHCEETIFYERARYVDKATDGNTMGCVLCPPIKCQKGISPTSENFKKYCNPNEEKGCGFAGDAEDDALQFCIDSNQELLKLKNMKFKDRGAQIGNYMFVNGGAKALKGSPVVAKPTSKFIRNFRVRGTSTVAVNLSEFRDSGGQATKKYVSMATEGKDVKGITLNEGHYLDCFSTDYVTGETSEKKLKYKDIEDGACYNYEPMGDDIEKVDCPDDAPYYQPPAPTTDPCKMSKCPIDMPLYYYENKDSKDTSLLYNLDNWSGCAGAVNWYMKKQGKTIGEAYDLVLGDVTNAKECQK